MRASDSTILVDEVPVPFEPGKTILQAALEAEVYIPHLCAHPEFAPHGSCKLCNVGNHFCPGCEKSGNCQLQALAYDSEMMTPHLAEFYPHRPMDASHPDVLIDFNRCIQCEPCVRASSDADGRSALLGGPCRRAAPVRYLPGQPPHRGDQGDGRHRRLLQGLIKKREVEVWRQAALADGLGHA